MNYRIRLLCVASFVLTATPVLAQGKAPTLRDEVREKGSAWQTAYPENRFLLTLDQMVSRSEIIFSGRVIGERTRLSLDEEAVLTDYSVEITEVYKDSLGMAGPGKVLLVSKAGGNLVLEGKPVRIDTPSFPPLQWISPYIFFVARPTWQGADFKFYFVGNSLGAIALEKDKVICKGEDEKLKDPITKPYCNSAGARDQLIGHLKERIAALANKQANR